VSERFYVALARCDAGIRGMGKADGSAAVARALRKSCEPIETSEFLTADYAADF
jgi:hypothetical protein